MEEKERDLQMREEEILEDQDFTESEEKEESAAPRGGEVRISEDVILQLATQALRSVQGVRPAVNTDLSMSRVGSSAQTSAMKSVAGQYLYSLSMDIKAIGTVVEQLAVGCVVLFGGSIVAVVAITMMSVSSAGI